MKLRTLLFIIILLHSALINAQVRLVNEKIQEGKIELEIDLSINYAFGNEQGIRSIEFVNSKNETKPGEFSLPGNNLLIAIPPQSYPEVKWQTTKEEILNAIPTINPSISGDVDAVNYYKIDNLNKNVQKPLIETLGYLWVGNNYCIHLKVHPVSIASNNIQTNVVQSFTLTIKDAAITASRSKIINEQKTNSLIINKSSAVQFWGSRPKIEVKTDDWIDLTKEYVKLGVTADGIYRISYNYLNSLGINIDSINPKTFKIFSKGNKIPIYVSGQEDNGFDETDYIEFVGQKNYGTNHRQVGKYGDPYNEYLNRYSEELIYWLTWNGEEAERVDLRDSDYSEFPEEILTYYYKIEHYEENKWFDSPMAVARKEMPFWYENKMWHDFSFGVGTTDKSFTLSNLYADANTNIFVKLMDYSSNIPLNAHRIDLNVNEDSELYANTIIDKYQKVLLKAEVPSTKLNDGENVLHINSYQTENIVNKCIFDWLEVEYPKHPVYESGGLEMNFPQIANSKVISIDIQNNGSNDKVMWKIGNSKIKYSPFYNNSAILFRDTLSNDDLLIVAEEQSIIEPRFIYKKQFKDWSQSQEQVDYILITSEKFLEASTSYINFLNNEYGINPIVIDINDIYDQYAYGMFNPEAIKDFLYSAKINYPQPSPQYVFFVGSANYDYYGNKAKYFGVNFVPNHVPSFGSPVSDNWYASFDTTGLFVPEYNVGRLPVTEVSEFNWYTEKHTSYRAQTYDDWNKTFLFFSGGNDGDATQQQVLKAVNDEIITEQIDKTPLFGNYNHFYKTENPFTNFGPFTQKQFDAAIQKGSVFISYIGHSGTRIWDNSIIEPLQLSNNRNRYPLITDFGCSTGRFAEPDVTSFSQLFTLSENGQAISYIGNASLGFISTATTAPQIFYNELVSKGVYQISEALKQAKLNLIQNSANEIQQIFTLTSTLIGDPIISLPIPPKANFNMSQEYISLENENPDDGMDNIDVTFIYKNYGLKTVDSLEIKIEHIYEEETVRTQLLKVECPEFESERTFSINIKNRSGLNSVKITLDPMNLVEEIYEDDNISEFTFNVFSSNLRTLLNYQSENSTTEIIFLNPASPPQTEGINIQIADKPDMSNFVEKNIDFDDFQTKLDLSEFGLSTKKWFNWKLENENEFNKPTGVLIDDNYSFFMSDSIDLINSELLNVAVSDNRIKLDSVNAEFEVLSAGFNDGNFAVIKKDGVNYVPINEIGHHICTFDKTTFEFIEYKKFDVFNGGPAAENEYINFIDTLKEDNLIVISVADEGSVSSPELKNKLKSIGSQYIDSLNFRGSWAIIGYKGAIPGTVKEGFTKPTNGSVSLTQLFKYMNTQGKFITTLVGPASQWESIVIDSESNQGSELKFRPLGISKTGIVDTLAYLEINDGVINLEAISSELYPYIKLQSELNSNFQSSPSVSSIGIKYTGTPELGTNYQVASLSADTVYQGDALNLDFAVWNAGYSNAENFSIKLSLLNSSNSSKVLFDSTITRIDAENKLELSYIYTSNLEDGYGNKQFLIEIDAENRIIELFKDNNVFSVPFYVIEDSSQISNSAIVNVKFDGRELYGGEYVAPESDISITLNYNKLFPVTDSSKISFYLDRIQIPYQNFIVNHEPSNNFIEYKYKGNFENGNHIFEVRGSNLVGNLESGSGYEINFLVSNSTQLVNLFNYPNPFSSFTHFTFQLPTIPNNLKIKIYTVSGRLIRDMDVSISQLNVGFNKIRWDGRDEDGDIIANGVYLYKAIAQRNGEKTSSIQKLTVFR